MPSNKAEGTNKGKKVSTTKKKPTVMPSSEEKKAAKIQTAEGWKRSLLKK